MVSNTNLKIALRHLTSRKKQTIIAILSVLFGVSMYIFMNGFMGGVNKMQTEMTFSSMAHIRIYNDVETNVPNLISEDDKTVVNVRNPKSILYSEGMKNATKIVEELRKNKQLSAVTSQVNLSATFRNGSLSFGGTISGIDVVNENKMFAMKQYVKAGKWDDLDNSNTNIILGIKLADKLGIKVNDIVLIATNNTTKNYKVVCILETGSSNVDGSKAFIKKSAALQLNSKNKNFATDIQINIPDYNQASDVVNTLKEIPYKVESWDESNGQLEAANTLRGIIALAVSLVIIIVAGFGIYNIMNMTVSEKIKEIAILKALGFGGSDVIQIFLTQAIIIGLLGGFFGLLIGFGIANAVSNVPFHRPGMDTMPMVFIVSDYVIAFTFGVVITIIAGYLPAKKAANVDPVSIIRG
jgi:lipoprotein-releasing system permease protein